MPLLSTSSNRSNSEENSIKNCLIIINFCIVLDSKDAVQLIQDLVHHDTYESPIDINLSNMTRIELPKLKWHHVDLMPKKMKVTNTGHTCKYIIYVCFVMITISV